MQNRPYIQTMKNVLTYARSRERVMYIDLPTSIVLFFSVFFLTFILCLLQAQNAWSGTVMDVNTLSQQTSNQESQQHFLGPWKNSNTPNHSQDVLWKKGTSAHDLLRKKNTATTPSPAKKEPGGIGMGPHPKTSPRGEQESKGVVLAGGAIEGDAAVVGSSWHGPGSEEPIIDEDMLKEQHDVVGAYGQVVAEDDFKMSLGPELYIPGDSSSLLGNEKSSASELGMGMKLQWGF